MSEKQPVQQAEPDAAEPQVADAAQPDAAAPAQAVDAADAKAKPDAGDQPAGKEPEKAEPAQEPDLSKYEDLAIMVEHSPTLRELAREVPPEKLQTAIEEVLNGLAGQPPSFTDEEKAAIEGLKARFGDEGAEFLDIAATLPEGGKFLRKLMELVSKVAGPDTTPAQTTALPPHERDKRIQEILSDRNLLTSYAGWEELTRLLNS